MHHEIKEIFDKFKGGAYYYDNDVVKFAIEDDFSPASITVSINNERASVWVVNDDYRGYYNSESKSIEGSMIYIHPDIVIEIEGLIIAVKDHLEKNGFDVEKYKTELAVSYAHWNDCKGRIREDVRLKNYENMKRIHDDESVELFWK